MFSHHARKTTFKNYISTHTN